MFSIGITVPMVFGDISTAEGTKCAAQAGADGIEFFDWENEDLGKLREVAEEAGIEIVGTLAAGAGSNIEEHGRDALVRPESHGVAVDDIKRSIEVAAELDCTVLIVTVGPEQPDLERKTQRDAIVDVLCDIAPAAEASGVTVVVEPLNVRVDHPGYFLTSSYEGYEIIEAVDSPSVKLLFDVYHQQITEGNIIQNFTNHLDLIGHVHIADVPGRHEPETGELNYRNVLAALADAGYGRYVSCEFFPSGDPETVVRNITTMANSL